MTKLKVLQECPKTKWVVFHQTYSRPNGCFRTRTWFQATKCWAMSFPCQTKVSPSCRKKIRHSSCWCRKTLSSIISRPTGSMLSLSQLVAISWPRPHFHSETSNNSQTYSSSSRTMLKNNGMRSLILQASGTLSLTRINLLLLTQAIMKCWDLRTWHLLQRQADNNDKQRLLVD